jgi:SAM-dependent methyltransferase
VPLFRTPDLQAEFIERISGRKTVDLGCGARRIPGALGVDLAPGGSVGLVHDLNLTPWPLADASFGAASLNHVIEHLQDIPRVIAECARILERGGLLWIATPHFSDVSSWTDPTHRFHLGLRSFEQFYAGANAAYRLELAYVRLNGRWRNFGYERWINRGQGHSRISDAARRWEDRQCFVRRGGEMCFVLERL